MTFFLKKKKKNRFISFNNSLASHYIGPSNKVKNTDRLRCLILTSRGRKTVLKLDMTKNDLVTVTGSCVFGCVLTPGVNPVLYSSYQLLTFSNTRGQCSLSLFIYQASLITMFHLPCTQCKRDFFWCRCQHVFLSYKEQKIILLTLQNYEKSNLIKVCIVKRCAVCTEGRESVHVMVSLLPLCVTLQDIIFTFSQVNIYTGCSGYK